MSNVSTAFTYHPNPDRAGLVRELTEADRDQALTLLATDPVHGVILQSMIEDNGLCSAAHRGAFYGYFENDQMTAIALLGRQLMFCGASDSLRYFAEKAMAIKAQGFVIFGHSEQVTLLQQHLTELGRQVRMERSFYWYVCEQASGSVQQLQMQKADLADLDVVVEAHALLHHEATGVNPLEADPEGFRRRAADRIERGRTWIKLEDNKVVFKIELQSITASAIYLEGIWTHPDYRNRNIAKECIQELTRRRLFGQQAICLVVEPHEEAAQHIYKMAGFEHHSDYLAVYLEPLAE